MSGMNHFKKKEMMVGYAQSKGVASPAMAVMFSGLLLLLGGLGIVLGVYPRIALVLIFIFLLPVTFKMHAFWKAQDPMKKMEDMRQFMVNMALIGATFALFSLSLPWALSLLS